MIYFILNKKKMIRNEYNDCIFLNNDRKNHLRVLLIKYETFCIMNNKLMKNLVQRIYQIKVEFKCNI